MKRKKEIILGIVLTLVMTAFATIPSTVAHTEEEPLIKTLYAGQDIPIGTISTWNDEDNIYVDYETTGGWEILNTHLYVGITNPNTLTTAPGQFPYSGETEYVIPLDEICAYQMELNKKGNPTGKMVAIDGTCGVDKDDNVYISAHADVRKLDSIEWNELLTNGGFETPAISSGWTIVPDISLPGWSTAPVTVTGGDPEGLEIQKNLLMTAYEGCQYAELDAYYPIILTQTVPACISGEYRLSYAYAPRPNVANNQLNVVFGDYEDDHSGSGVGGSSWTYVDELVTGPTCGMVDLVFTETGPDDQLGMFLDDVSLQCKVYNYIYESAWGDGTDFDQPNWAMYFNYDIQGWELVDTVYVSAKSTTPVSTIDLDEGEYKIIASGTAFAGDTIEFDAKYSITSRIAGDTWTDLVSGYEGYGPNLLELKVDGSFVDWGAYNEDHEYTIYLIGTGTPVTFEFVIYDIYPPNNAGGLTVNIYEWA